MQLITPAEVNIRISKAGTAVGLYVIDGQPASGAERNSTQVVRLIPAVLS
jgi:hypothetical protein